jgi:hypothetical protein
VSVRDYRTGDKREVVVASDVVEHRGCPLELIDVAARALTLLGREAGLN